MLHYIYYLSLHYMLCVIFFVLLQRPIFFVYNKATSAHPVGASDLWDTTRIGFKTDLAGAAYLTAIPLIVLYACIGMDSMYVPLCITDAALSILIALMMIGDTILYGYWRFRIDVSVLVYLKSIKSALASVTVGYAIVAICLVVVTAGAVYSAFYGIAIISGVYSPDITLHGAWHILGAIGTFLLFAAVIFASIRGLNHRPNSPYHLYYSSNMYLNHTAVNPMFNFAYSASVKSKEGDQFKIFDPKECEATVRPMLPTEGTPKEKLLRTDRPNILVIVWESLSAYFVEPLGGKPDVTPNLNRLSKEGILFTRVDAGSWRTDPALVCTLSGYPAQPTTSIMRDTHKLPGLPALPRTLKAQGYSTTAIHGGPLSYMHMIDYFMASGHDRVIGINDIADDSAPKCAWGIHDGYMFDWLYRDLTTLNAKHRPWYATFLTLSSHQPYIVPYKRLDDEIDNSYAYTDEAFGRFIERLKQSPMWDDTLVVVLGDHGINISFLPMPRHQQTHIPLLLLGGAIREPRKIDTLMSQCDLAATLLGQLGVEHGDFTFSRDVLADTYTSPFAINIYNNGFLYRDATGYTEFDNVAKRAVDGADSERERRGRMFMQYMMADLSKR